MIIDGRIFFTPTCETESITPSTEIPYPEPTDKFEWAISYGEVKLYWFFNGEADEYRIDYHGSQISITQDQSLVIPGFHFITNPDGTLDTTFHIYAIRNGIIIDTIEASYIEGMTDMHCVVEGNVISLFGQPISRINVYLQPAEPSPVIVNGKIVSHTKAHTMTKSDGSFRFVVVKGIDVRLYIPAAYYQTEFKIPNSIPYIAPIGG